MANSPKPEKSPGRPLPRWLAGFARITSGHTLLPEVDGLRFLAIAAVVLFHMDTPIFAAHPEALKGDVLSRALHHVLARGNFGVPLFFSISGFILMLPFARAAAGTGTPVRLGNYFLRRLTRLEPPYVLCMVALYLMDAHHFGRPLGERLPNLVASLLYLHNLIYAAPSVINIPAWSLEIEVQFYCLAPVLALLFRLRPATRRIVLVCLGIGGCLLSLTPLATWRSVLTHGQYFLVGMLCADLQANGGFKWNGSRWFDAVFLLGLVLPVAIPPPPATAAYLFVAPVSVLALLAGTLWSVTARRFFSQPLIYVLGGMCYTIYLWHGLVWTILWHRIDGLGKQLPFWAYFSLQSIPLLAFVTIVCAVLFRLLERPFMQRDWPSRLAAILRPSASPNPPPPAPNTGPAGR